MRQPGPDHPISLAPFPGRVTIRFGGAEVATSGRALEMRETTLPPVLYIPREDANLALLQPSPHATHCPYKGDASYYSIEAGGRRAENAVWSYETPFPAMAASPATSPSTRTGWTRSKPPEEPAMRRAARFLLLLATPAFAAASFAPRGFAQGSMAQGSLAQGSEAAAAPDTPASTPIAPLPVPPLDENAPPAAFVRAAITALAAGHPGEAQEAIERAEARLLVRDVDPRRIQEPSENPLIAQLREARALIPTDRSQALAILQNLQARL
jgi:uncharacterized protein (DUF427 family)